MSQTFDFTRKRHNKDFMKYDLDFTNLYIESIQPP